MADKRDFYEVLGVGRSATSEEIATAYRRLALQYHPDRNPGDEEAVARFKEAAEAFEVLNNPESRARYDRYGHAGLAGGGAPHFHDIGEIFEAFGDIFGEGLFGDFFGGRGGGRRRRQGAHLRCDVTLDLLEAASGTTKAVQFQRHEHCETCSGSGAKPGTSPDVCNYCGGAGRILQRSGIFSLQATCPVCHGAGSVVRQPCETCHGSGLVVKRVTRKVNIPAGVDDGNQLRLTGEGEPSPNGGPPGDCFCVIHVTEHPLFVRKGQHLLCEVPISYSQAALGAKLSVPTLDGPEELEIPQGTQSGEVFTLRGRGMPDPRYRGRGDLLVQVNIEVPRKPAPEQEELLRRLAEIENTQVTPKRLSFLEKLKNYFHTG